MHGADLHHYMHNMFVRVRRSARRAHVRAITPQDSTYRRFPRRSGTFRTLRLGTVFWNVPNASLRPFLGAQARWRDPPVPVPVLLVLLVSCL